MIIPVILAGGKGARLWPLSRETLPKPYAAIMGAGPTLLQSTFQRLQAVPDLDAPVVVCNATHDFLVRSQATEAGARDLTLLLEPEGRNTGPAICASALAVEQLAGPGALLLILPADHVIADETAFSSAVASAADIAQNDYLVTFAITPTEAATGYGYLKIGQAIDGERRQFLLDAFVEKPGRETAESFIASGQFAWNSGMFMFKAATVLAAFREWRPEILEACRRAVPATLSGKTIRLDGAAFSAAPPISFDHAIMEKAANAATVVADLGWSDVGDWKAVWAAAKKDGAGVAVRGNAQAMDCRDTLLLSGGPLIVGVGLNNVIAVAAGDALVVAPMERAQEVKRAVDALHASGRSEASSGMKVFRPWGWFESIRSGPGFQIKEIALSPGAKQSLQRHKFRAEHWVCIAGKAIVTVGEQKTEIGVNMSVHIPLGATHRLENPGHDILRIIEVQIGSYTGEDDIERIEDIYGRT